MKNGHGSIADLTGDFFTEGAHHHWGQQNLLPLLLDRIVAPDLGSAIEAVDIIGTFDRPNRNVTVSMKDLEHAEIRAGGADIETIVKPAHGVGIAVVAIPKAVFTDLTKVMQPKSRIRSWINRSLSGQNCSHGLNLKILSVVGKGTVLYYFGTLRGNNDVTPSDPSGQPLESPDPTYRDDDHCGLWIHCNL